MNRPNIVYIHSHDTGRYIQPYGHAVSTPQLQKFAESATLFRQAFCVNPTCSPSRAALLTGRYPHVNGMFGLAHRGFRLKDYATTLPNTLRKAGYHTVLAGLQHIIKGTAENFAEKIGYAQQFSEPKQAADNAIAFLKQAPRKPFFLDVGFFETHREFPELKDAADAPQYGLPPAPLPDTPETRADMARYKASARILDQKIGAVLEALDAQGLGSNTLVICTTDHGIAFPRMKCNLQDSGTGVLLMMRGPGLGAGQVVDGMVSHMDVFPTVCEIAGLEKPAWLQGQSVLPLVRGEQQEIHEQLFFEINYHAAYEPMRGVRTKRWKYIRQFTDRDRPVLSNCDNGLSKNVWTGAHWPDRAVPSEALYDLNYDPNEGGNLIHESGVQDVLADLRARMLAWMQETGDPLLAGPAPAPVDAVVDAPDCLSPGEKTVSVLQQHGPAYIQHEY